MALALMCFEGIGSWLSGSLALLADTMHVLGDSAALGFTLFASWLAARPQTPERSYGYYRIEILAALLNGSVLLVLSFFILKSAYDRFSTPHEISAGLMLWVAIIGLLVNLMMLFVLRHAHSHNLNTRGAYLHILGDTLSSIAVVISALLIQNFGWIWSDALAGVFVGIMIASMAGRLIWDSINILLEGSPKHLNPVEIEKVLQHNFPQIKRIHDFHIWEITNHLFAMTAHVEVKINSLNEHKVLLDQMNILIKDKYGIGHTTFQIELAAD